MRREPCASRGRRVRETCRDPVDLTLTQYGIVSIHNMMYCSSFGLPQLYMLLGVDRLRTHQYLCCDESGFGERCEEQDTNSRKARANRPIGLEELRGKNQGLLSCTNESICFYDAVRTSIVQTEKLGFGGKYTRWSGCSLTKTRAFQNSYR